ncbi:MAG TPA: preprotein translocase subunit SecE [Candidatus Blautia faecipullorum]|nr:preprotein translocase subunit SecE [Candidatus Blautia faecipullorum]
MQEKEKSTGKRQKKNWFQGLQSEFRKIVWTDRPTLAKQTVAVSVITVILAVMISIMDSAILEGINLLIR